MFDCCINILHHLDDIKLYLETYSNILNGVAILDRTFLDMEMLKPIFCSAALIGIHITRPFLSILLDTETTYDTLRSAFPILYNDLSNPNIERFLQTQQQATNFINDERFKSSLPNDCLLECIDSCCTVYKKEICQLLNIILPRLAEGFSEQRGALFGFGPKANDDTGTLLKVSEVNDEAKRRKLNQVPVHNLNEERSVGFINYELNIRGKQCLESASKKMILNKGKDLLQGKQPDEMKKFRKPAIQIKEIKLQWKSKIKAHQQEAYSEKEKSCLKSESTRYELLEMLKKEDIPGPFTSETEIREYIVTASEDSEKNKRMYNEVKYARISCMSLKPTASVFRLRRNHKNLPTEEYAENLISFLNNARCCKTLTVDDLNNVMRGIVSRSTNDENDVNDTTDKQSLESLSCNEDAFKVGDHVIAFWIEGNETQWYLGFIDGMVGDNPLISYMKRTDKIGRSWTYPESAEILETNPEQILARKVKVQYLGSVRIRLNIVSQELIEEMNKIIKSK